MEITSPVTICVTAHDTLLDFEMFEEIHFHSVQGQKRDMTSLRHCYVVFRGVTLKLSRQLA
jgi:hypothetical protein